MPNFRRRCNPRFSPSASNTPPYGHIGKHTCRHLPPTSERDFSQAVWRRRKGGLGCVERRNLAQAFSPASTHKVVETWLYVQVCALPPTLGKPRKYRETPVKFRDLFLSLSPLLMHSRHRRSNLVPSLSCTACCVSNNSFRKLGSALQ